jgi:hypothetical protein
MQSYKIAKGHLAASLLIENKFAYLLTFVPTELAKIFIFPFSVLEVLSWL